MITRRGVLFSTNYRNTAATARQPGEIPSPVDGGWRPYPQRWTTVLTTNLITNYPYLCYRDTNTTNFPRRFYRIVPG